MEEEDFRDGWEAWLIALKPTVGRLTGRIQRW